MSLYKTPAELEAYIDAAFPLVAAKNHVTSAKINEVMKTISNSMLHRTDDGGHHVVAEAVPSTVISTTATRMSFNGVSTLIPELVRLSPDSAALKANTPALANDGYWDKTADKAQLVVGESYNVTFGAEVAASTQNIEVELELRANDGVTVLATEHIVLATSTTRWIRWHIPISEPVAGVSNNASFWYRTLSGSITVTQHALYISKLSRPDINLPF